MVRHIAAIVFILCALRPGFSDDVAGLRCRVIDSEIVMSYSNKTGQNETLQPAPGFVLLKARLEFNNSGNKPDKISLNAMSVVDANGKRASGELMAVGDSLKLPEVKLIKLFRVKGGRNDTGVQVSGTLAARSAIEWEIPAKTKYEETIVFAVPARVRGPKILIADKWVTNQ